MTPVVVDDGPDQAVGGVRRHDDVAAVGADDPAVLDQRTDRAAVDDDAQQAVAGHVERHRRPRGERDRAEARRDQPGIADGRAEQRDIAAVGALIVPSLTTLPPVPVK